MNKTSLGRTRRRVLLAQGTDGRVDGETPLVGFGEGDLGSRDRGNARGYFCVFVACFLVTACHKAADRAQSGNNAGTPELALDDHTVRVQDSPQGDGGTEGGANCAGGGTLVTGADGGSTTVNSLARSIFTNALCSCDSLAVSGKLKTDGFDSTVGPPDGGTGATVAINGLVNWTAATASSGDLWAGAGLSSVCPPRA
jgi:hypothetical protein